MILKNHIAILIFLLSYLNSYAQTEFYVSHNGRDSWPGTINKPFQTLGRAKAEVLNQRILMNEDIIVNIRDGEYVLQNTLAFNASDGGIENHKVIYKGYNDERPIISGGIKISNWQKGDNDLWHALVPAGLNFRQLYIDKLKATRSRKPNKGDYHKVLNWDFTDKSIHLQKGLVNNWNNFQQVEIVVQTLWAEAYLRLESFQNNVEGARSAPGRYVKLFINETERDIIFNQPHPGKLPNAAFHFENALEFVDQYGEWYLDTQKNIVYYKAHPWENMNEKVVIAPNIETLIHVEGTFDEPVKNLVFSGLGFRYSTWLRPSEHGHLDGQAGQYVIKSDLDNNQYSGRPESAIYVKAGNKIRIERCVFKNLGATAVDFHLGVSDSEIEGNVFQEIAGSAISLGEFSAPDIEYHTVYNPEDEREICKNDKISNNIIKHAAQDYYGCIGIAAGYPREAIIEHNDISYLPYTGISVGWGWTQKDNAMRDNKIQRNEIHHVMMLLEDGGAIYTLSRQPGTHIFANYIHDITPSKWILRPIVRGIYLDEGSDDFIVEKNVMDGSGYEKFRTHNSGSITLIDEGWSHQEVRDHAGPTGEYIDLWEFVD